MKYLLKFKIEAENDLKRLSPDIARRILRKMERMRNDLAGDVKRLVRCSTLRMIQLSSGVWCIDRKRATER